MKKILSPDEMCGVFGVTKVTLYHWRKGTFHKTALPYHTKPHGSLFRVYYKLAEIKKWARENDVEMNTEPKS